MGDIRPRNLIRKARAIVWRRDYEAARTLIAGAMRSLDDDRFLALLAELSDYEKRRPLGDAMRVVEWAEFVFVPALARDGEPLRRWTDTPDQD
jgi:hypothetical protein